MRERRVFISYSSRDSAAARRICVALEQRGCPCWIANRDVGAGENYQEAIVRAIEQARVMVLVFSANSNESREIAKELSLASRRNLVVIPARTEDVAPSGAFAYEIATRQWIDLFQDWDGALDGLAERVRAILASLEPDEEKTEEEKRDGGMPPETIAALTDLPPIKPVAKPAAPSSRGPFVAVALVLAALAGGIGYFVLKPDQKAAVAPAPSPIVAVTPAAIVAPPPVEKPAAPPPVARPVEPQVAPPAAPPPAPQPQPVVAPQPVEPAASPRPLVVADAAPVAADVGAGGQLFRDCPTCPVMVSVPAGSAAIGSPNAESGHDSTEEPRKRVTFAHPFAIGRDAVTFSEWQACVAEGGCGQYWPTDMGWGQGDRPAIFVSWSDAKSYVEWLSNKTGKTYRLPSEAEWEYAARGCRAASCADEVFWFGSASDPNRANYDWRLSYGGGAKAQAPRKTLPVGRFGPNGFGLFDAAGNVAQWTQDCWNADLRALPADGSAQTHGDCLSRVYRGGSWMDDPLYLRSAARKSDLASSRLPYVGFRVARDLP